MLHLTAPLSAVPLAEASPQLPSTPSAVIPSNNGNHSSLILVIAIGSGILIIAIISILVICHCVSHRGKKRASITEPVKTRTVDAVPIARSLPHPHPSNIRFLAYEDLKEGKDNFEPASLLGEGGFG
ncbi:hypothetical protein ACH5RR_010863 [Cinchona calisaya]|uniref:Uncharacterized protein n=1 Tax=Cinchona calisaya TaxID=153742 RepID=A0ABD3AK33_9GENT